MIVELQATNKVVELDASRLVERGETLTARIWEGTTGTGIVVHALIVRIAHADSESADVVAQFRRELEATSAPSRAVAQAYDIRMFL